MQLKALEGILLKTPEYYYRKICRWYSKEFSTPLKGVYDLPMDFVLEHYYESFLEKNSYNEVFDIAVQEYLPEIAAEEDKAAQEYADSLVEEQEKTLKLKEKSQSLDKKPHSDSNKKAEEEIKIDPINLNFE